MGENKLSRKDEAKALFLQGYNCSQSVLLAFADDIGVDKETASLLALGLGGGVGRMREVCGTILGASMVLGVVIARKNPKDIEAKKEVYAAVQKLSEQFKEQNGSIICRELLGTLADSGATPSVRNAEYYKKRPCSDLVKCTAELLEKMI
ncbi:MAG: C-GCAxxG-C-C family protein [Oscillospiraceae bacterium]